MKCAVFALSLCPAALQAQATQLQVPHEHGSGSLGITLSETEFTLSLAVPSADIVGFERPAENDDERALVAVAISDLSKPLELFVTSEEAGCMTGSANVILTGESLGQDDSASDDTTRLSEPPEHTEFQADYVITCQDMMALETIEFAYFDRFEGTEKLHVQIESSGAIRSIEMTRATPFLDLSKLR